MEELKNTQFETKTDKETVSFLLSDSELGLSEAEAKARLEKYGPNKLEEKNLNETEIRYCILTLLDFPQKEKAEILYYGYPSAIKTLKRRTSDKLGTTPPKLRNFLFSIAANAEIS